MTAPTEHGPSDTSDHGTNVAVATGVQLQFEKMVSARALPKTRRGCLVEGLRAPITGLRFVAVQRQYLKLFFVPVAVQTILSTGLIICLAFAGWALSGWLQSAAVSAIAWLNSDVASETVGTLTQVLIVAAIVIAFFYLFNLLWRISGGLLDDYYGDVITNRVMTDLGVQNPTPPTSVGATIFNTVKAIGLGHLVVLICSPLSIVPVVGSFAAVGAGAVTMLFLKGADELSDPLTGFGVDSKQVLAMCGRHKLTTIGLAISKAALEPIPFIGGVLSAAESVGRIFVAKRLLNVESKSQADQL